MVKEIKKVTRSPIFIKQTKKLVSFCTQKLKKQILKILENPEVGKPLRYTRGERTLYIKPFRLSYIYLTNEKIVYILDLYHKKSQ